MKKSPATNQVPESPVGRLQRPRLQAFSPVLTLVILSLCGCSNTESQPVDQMSEARADIASESASPTPKRPDLSRTGPVEYTKIGIIAMDATPWALERNYARLERYVREAAERDAQVRPS